jgi:alcohol dehydrogenase class IV
MSTDSFPEPIDNCSANYPRKILFGWGACRQLPGLLNEVRGAEGGTHLLVTFLVDGQSPVADCFAEILGEPLALFTNITPEPRIGEVDALADVIRDLKPDAVVAVGGGSVIDVAKVASMIASSGGKCTDYYYDGRELGRREIPFAALPSTAGTGSEMTKNSVLIDPDTKIKQSIRHPDMVPTIALVDPELTVTVPASVTAATGLDAMTQAIESYISLKANPVTMPLAAEAVRLIMASIEAAVRDGTDREARLQMAKGSMLSAMAFSQSGLGAVHGLAHPLGSLLAAPHGLTCAILLPHILKFNREVSHERLDDLGVIVGLEGGEAFIGRVCELCTALNVPGGFSGFGLNPAHFPFIVENCRSSSMAGNPRTMDDAQVLELLKVLV